MKKLYALVIALTLISHITFSNISTKSYFNKFIDIFKTYVERGIEIRYYFHKNASVPPPQEIIVNEVKYPLYKSREIAIETIKNASIKKDYSIVYVISVEEKNTEIISIFNEN